MSDNTFGGAGVQITALQARETSLLQTARAPTHAAKIDKAATEFEAVLLGNWLQQAEQSFATVPGSNDDQDAGSGQMLSMGVQSLATAMVQSGALGIGKMIATAMHRMADMETPSSPNVQRMGSTETVPGKATEHLSRSCR